MWWSVAQLIGWQTVLWFFLPATVLASIVGVWMFYVQHQFEGTYWRNDGDWTFLRAALEGSSHLHLPWLANWFTGDIGLHHIHHLNSRIPNYRLREFADSEPALANGRRVTFHRRH